MKGKNGVKLADFIREIINTKISENPVKSRVSGVFSFLRRNSKNEKITNFHQQILRLLMEFRTNVVRLSGGQLANKN